MPPKIDEFCTNCGHALDAGGAFCINCGVVLQADQPSHIASKNRVGGSQSRNKIKWIVAVVVLVLGALASSIAIFLPQHTSVQQNTAADSVQQSNATVLDTLLRSLRSALSTSSWTKSVPDIPRVLPGKWVEYSDDQFLNSSIEFFKDNTFVDESGLGGQWIAVDDGRVKLERKDRKSVV